MKLGGVETVESVAHLVVEIVLVSSKSREVDGAGLEDWHWDKMYPIQCENHLHWGRGRLVMVSP